MRILVGALLMWASLAWATTGPGATPDGDCYRRATWDGHTWHYLDQWVCL